MAKILRSETVISTILERLGLIRIGPSTYESYFAEDGTFLRLKISDHGVVLSTWFRHYENDQLRLDNGANLAITISPCKDECQEKGQKFPLKIVNKTTVFKSPTNTAKIDFEFTVFHYVYDSWKLSSEDVEKISAELKQFIKTGQYNDPLAGTKAKTKLFVDTSNRLFEKKKRTLRKGERQTCPRKA